MNFAVKGLTLVACVLPLKTSDKIWTDDMTDQEKCQAEADFMLKYRKNIHVCKTCQNRTDFKYIEIPYACKLMMQELITMNIAPRILTK